MPDDRWTSDAFHEEVRRWVADALRAEGTVLTGEWWQRHVRPWSSAIGLGTTDRPVWFKVNGPGTRHGSLGGLEPAQVDRLLEALPRLDAWCAELAASAVPSSLQHDDLHSGNVCVADEAMRIIDWGDASWGYPLATMLTTLRSVAHHAGLPEEAPQVRRLRDAYLEPFTSYGVRADLVRWTQLANRAGCVAKALAWRAAMSGSPAMTSQEYDHPVRAWLLELLEWEEVSEPAAT